MTGRESSSIREAKEIYAPDLHLVNGLTGGRLQGGPGKGLERPEMARRVELSSFTVYKVKARAPLTRDDG